MHFEPKDGGYFIRSLGSSSSSSTEDSNNVAPPPSPDWDGDITNIPENPTVLNTEHFTVLPSSQAVSIRVGYGPFSTKQTVPVRLLVPDPLENGAWNGTMTEAEMVPPLDLSAHIVTPTIPKDTPILRVLFHAGQTAFGLPITTQNTPRGTVSRQQVGSHPDFHLHPQFLCRRSLQGRRTRKWNNLNFKML